MPVPSTGHAVSTLVGVWSTPQHLMKYTLECDIEPFAFVYCLQTQHGGSGGIPMQYVNSLEIHWIYFLVNFLEPSKLSLDLQR